jgi:acyl carrier protein
MSEKEKVVAVIKTILTQKQLTARSLDAEETPLDLDSMARLTLIVELENEFQVTLMESASPSVFQNIAMLSDFVVHTLQESRTS